MIGNFDRMTVLLEGKNSRSRPDVEEQNQYKVPLFSTRGWVSVCTSYHNIAGLCIKAIVVILFTKVVVYMQDVSQCLSQDLETGCLKLAVVKSLGVQIFKGDHNILIFQQYTCINSSKKALISLNNVMGIIRR